jgi:cobalt-zinc-cadmium efflux system outer membrane protein
LKNIWSSVFLIFVIGASFGLRGEAAAEGQRTYTLDDLISIALERNPSASVFQAALEAGKANILSARAYPNPEMEFMGGAGKSLETSAVKDEYSIGITQPIELSKKRFYRQQAAEAEAEVLGRDIDNFRLEVIAGVKTGFYLLLLNKKVLDITVANYRTVEEFLNSVSVRVKAGETPEFELVKAKVELMRADKERRKAANKIVISRASLSALLGGALEKDFDIAGDFAFRRGKNDLKEFLSRAMRNHPLILKAKKEVEAKGFSFELEKASVFPDVALKAGVVREMDKDTYTMGISMPIPFWYQRKGEITSASARKAKAEAELVRTEVELSNAIIEEYQNYSIAYDQIEIFEEGLLNQAEEALRIANLSYIQGESGILDYIDAQRVHRAIGMEYYQSFFELESATASLERVSGGMP